MIETVKHLLGTCGESHINLLSISIIVVFIVTTLKTIKKTENE
jgi:hypothetical protein